MSDSPSLNAGGVVRVSVSSNGQALAETTRIISVTINRAVNTIPSAVLVIADGDMQSGTFPISDTADLAPGARIKICAGYGGSDGNGEDSIFEGVVIKQGIKIAGENRSRLIVECRDAAVKMTIGRRNANYIDQTDSDIITNLIGAHNLHGGVAATAVEYKELVQYYCSDWDFMLSRAEANGQLVIVADGVVVVDAPQTTSRPTLAVTYGTDLIEFQAEIDARAQQRAVQTVSWDPKTQTSIASVCAMPAALNAQGNLDSATLAKVIGPATFNLQTAAPQSKAALDSWAKAAQVKAGLARIRGRMKFQGSAKSKVGGLITIKGVGARYSGDVFVGAVRHEIVDGNWITEAEFGVAPEWFAERTDIVAPLAAGLLPGVEGLQIGVVMALDGDPEGLHRLKVSTPVMRITTDGVWARLAQFYASDGAGVFFMPEVGDEVILGYLNNDPSSPIILGSMYSSRRNPPSALVAENNVKAIVTRSKLRIEFDDDDKVITVTTPGSNKLIFSDKGQSIRVQDQNNNRLELSPEGITLDSPKDIKISAKGTMTLDANGAINITSNADIKSVGLNVSCEGQVGFVGKGSATAELSATGTATVKGAIVMIN